MTKYKYPYQRLRELLTASITPTADDFAALADVTAAAAEVNVLDGNPATLTAAELGYLDTSAPGTVSASKAMVVDASLQVSGWRRKSVSVDGGNINAAMAGAIVDNAPSGSAAVFNLPAALVGMEFYFYVLAAFALRINPDGTETIGLPSSGVQQAAGKYIEADAVGEYVHVVCVKAGQWETLDYRGTWTVEG